VVSVIDGEQVKIQTGDVLAIASKIVSTCERRIVKLARVRVTRRAHDVSNHWGLDSRLTAVVLREADEVCGGVKGFLLTFKNGMLVPNAGVDLKNSPRGTAVLWPVDPDRSARELRMALERQHGARIGVVIVDSHITPLRLGTVGLALGLSGLVPIQDHRGIRDIFGRTIRVTQSNAADDIASAAHLLMGEATDHIGAVLIRNAPIKLQPTADGKHAKLARDECLIANNLRTADSLP
jgi:coenzyme F420-0:L-glutamate ligase